VRNVGIAALGDFQGLWEEMETAFCFSRFSSGRHFHRRRGRRDLCFVIWPINLAGRFLYPPLSLLVMTFGKRLMSCLAFTVASA
jgi:hypothetical protein